MLRNEDTRMRACGSDAEFVCLTTADGKEKRLRGGKNRIDADWKKRDTAVERERWVQMQMYGLDKSTNGGRGETERWYFRAETRGRVAIGRYGRADGKQGCVEL